MKKNQLKNLYFLSLVVLAIFSFIYLRSNFFESKTGGKKSVLSANPGEVVIRDVDLQDDFTGAKVAEEDLLRGCPRKDCIPSIDKPTFETVNKANTWLRDEDRVFVIDYEGVTKVYPQRIMNWHEIVNDSIGETPIAVTFCPLCGSALAFERVVDGVITELGVSGKLHESDLVMYDRYEGNLWQQITGEAIVGPAARRNEKLTRIPIITTSWGQWKIKYPDAQVLSLNTGFSRDYDQYPYGTYEQNDQLLFGVKNLNKSLQIKTVVYGVDLGDVSKAYPADIFDETPLINDVVAGIPITLKKQANDEIIVTNLNTATEIISTRLFWFAWASFHPDTELYSLK